MNAYFDSSEDNLTNLPRKIAADNSGTMRKFLTDTKFNVVISDNYTDRGVYIVNVMGFANQWSGYGDSHVRHILYELPSKVIDAARAKKLIIVINSQAEGFPLIYKGVDGYLEMHKAMNNLRLPLGSVLLIDANRDTGVEYDAWRVTTNNKEKMFEHIPFLSCFYYFHNKRPPAPLITKAISNTKSKDFNCLNRTVRSHRIDLLYKLITDNLYTKGLVSGHYSNNKHPIVDNSINPTYISDDRETYRKTLIAKCPLTVDGEWYNDNPDRSQIHIFNYEIYANSLMSVVTETAFPDNGMFITEKVFKSIVAGHPFIVFGQTGYLDALEELGYQVDFDGVDRRYDTLKSPHDRFNAAYEQVKKWISIDRQDKIRMLTRSMDKIVHNQRLFNTKNYTIESYENFYSKINEMFTRYGQG